MQNKRTHFIGGTWLDGSGTEFSKADPMTGEVVWRGFEARAGEIGQAVQAAQNAFRSWSQTSAKDRAAVLNCFAGNLKKNEARLAHVISQETGKPLWESRAEVQSMIGKVPVSINAFEERCRTSKKKLAHAVSITCFKPHGVVAVFGPFNFPGHLPNGHIVPALLAGNTVVFKPSELTPATAQLTVELWEESGIPRGVIGLVQGASATGKLIVSQPGIDAVFFTGSAGTGQLIHQAFAQKPQIILALEMGGNNPLVIDEFPDIKKAVDLTIQSAFISAGQRCSCARRAIVTESKMREGFLQALCEEIKKIRAGDFRDQPEPFMGCVISTQAAQGLLDEQERLTAAGATPLVKMQRLKEGTPLLSPGLIDVTAVKKSEDKEIFGPLLQLIRVRDLDAAIREAGNTQYGLAAGIVTGDKKNYEVFYNRIRAGVINWNQPLTGARSEAPFGGVGLSGNHRPSAYFAADYCSYPVALLQEET